MAFIALYSSFVLSLVLLVAGYSKLRQTDYERKVALEQFDFLPELMRRLAASLLPYVEIGLALLALSGQLWKISHIAILAMLLIFTLVVAVRWRMTGSISCNCFGHSVEQESKPGLFFARNFLFLALGLVALSTNPYENSVRVSVWVMGAILALASAFTLLLAKHLFTELTPQLAENPPPKT
jgi:uncharacterized membrane protein YphA (DoxX/SURF4 family)